MLANLLVWSACTDSRRHTAAKDAGADSQVGDADANDGTLPNDEAGQQDADANDGSCSGPAPFEGDGGKGEYLGQVQQTFYWLVLETECQGPPDSPDVAIYDENGDVLATVSQDFACKLGLEGSGRLADGRVVNYYGSGGSCVRVTDCSAPYYPSHNCYTTLDEILFPWGKGVRGRALVPFLSIATDPDVIGYGTIVYVPEWDGYHLPDGSYHDGCLRSDDTGGAIIGDHIDFFVGPKSNYDIVGPDFPSNVTLYVNPQRCPVETEWFGAIGAGCCSDADCPYAHGVCLAEPDFPGGSCSLPTCSGGDCPDVGGYEAFCTNVFSGGTCVERCSLPSDCRPGYDCVEITDLAGGTSMGCIPKS